MGRHLQVEAANTQPPGRNVIQLTRSHSDCQTCLPRSTVRVRLHSRQLPRWHNHGTQSVKHGLVTTLPSMPSCQPMARAGDNSPASLHECQCYDFQTLLQNPPGQTPLKKGTAQTAGSSALLLALGCPNLQCTHCELPLPTPLGQHEKADHAASLTANSSVNNTPAARPLLVHK
jgi:hypothetical protein